MPDDSAYGDILQQIREPGNLGVLRDQDAKDWLEKNKPVGDGMYADQLANIRAPERPQVLLQQQQQAVAEDYEKRSIPEQVGEFVTKRSLGFASPLLNFQMKRNYKQSLDRFNAGTASDEDVTTIAAYQHGQKHEAEKGIGASMLSGLAHIPAILTEGAVAGGAVRGGAAAGIRLGGRAAAATAGEAAAGVTLRGTAAATPAWLGRTAAQTVLMPSMYLPQSADNAIKNGGEWSDLKNLGPAYAIGTAQVGLLGGLSQAPGAVAKAFPATIAGRSLSGNTLGAWATRLMAGTGTGMTGQEAIDTASHIAGWKTEWGTMTELVNGKEGAMKHAAVQAAVFAVFSALHAHHDPNAARTQQGTDVLAASGRYLDLMKMRGYSESAAGKEMQQVHQAIMDQIQGKDIEGAYNSFSKMGKQYADTLVREMDVPRLAEEQAQVEQQASQKPPSPVPLPTAAPEGPVNAPESTPAAKGQPATEAAKAPEPTPGTPESFAQRLASGKDTVADVFRDFHEQGGKPEGWTAIEGRAAELNPEYGAPKVPMSKTVPGVGRTVKPIPEAPESVFHITDYKTPSKSVGTAIDILARKGSAPRPLEVWDAGKGKGGREGFDANFKSSHVAFEFDTGKHTGEMIRGEAGKPQGRFTSTDPLRYNPGLKAIHYKGSEADPAFARLKAEVDDINADRADGKLMREYGHKEALDPVELKATEQVSKPAGPTAEPTPEAPVPRTPEPLTQAKFDAVFNRLNKGDNYVSVADIRDALPDTSKAEVDAMLLNLRKERQYTLKRSGVDQVQPRVLEAAIREDGDALTHVGRLPTASAAKEAPPRPHMNDVPMHIQEVLDRADLTPREKAVLEGRAQGNTHGELAPEFKVSRQAVSQIEQGAMAKLGLEHKSMAEWLKAGVDEAPKGVASFDPEVLNRIAKETSDVPDDSLEDHLREEFPETYKAVDDFDAATKALTQEVKDATDQFVRESGSNDPEALRRQIESAVQEVIEGTRPPDTSAGTEGATAQGNAEPAAAAPAAGREAANRELKFRTVAQEIQARGGISPKSFADIHGKEITAEFQKEFPMMFRGRNLRSGSNNFEELVEDLVRHRVITVPEGMKATDAILELIKGHALDLSQNLDAKYQAEAEAYDRAQSEVKKAGFSTKAVAEAGRLGEELAADEESQRQAEADRLSEADETAAAQQPGALDFDPSTFGRPLTPGERATGGIGGGQPRTAAELIDDAYRGADVKRDISNLDLDGRRTLGEELTYSLSVANEEGSPGVVRAVEAELLKIPGVEKGPDAGRVVPFQGRLHIATEPISQDAPVLVKEAGWMLGDYILSKAKVRPFNPAEFSRPVRGVGPERPEPSDAVMEAAKEFAKEEGGHVVPEAILSRAYDLAARIGNTIRFVQNNWREFAGNQFPRTARLTENVAQKMVEWVHAKTAAIYGTPHYIDLVMGSLKAPAKTQAGRLLDALRGQQVPQAARRMAGAIETEWRLEYMHKAYTDRAADLYAQAQKVKAGPEYARLTALAQEAAQDAAGVGTVIGAKDSPLQTDAQYRAELNSPGHKAIQAKWEQHMVPEMEANFKKAMGLDPQDAIDSFTQRPGHPINLKNIGPNDVMTSSAIQSIPRGPSRGNLGNVRQGRLGFSRQAKGTGTYDIDLGAIIANSLGKGLSAAGRAEALKSMIEADVATPGEPFKTKEGYTEFKNTFPEAGNALAEKGETSLYVKNESAGEYRQALQVDEAPKYPLIAGFNQVLTRAALASSVEFVYHGKNLLTFLFKPGVRLPDLLKNAYNVVRNTPEGQAQLFELAKAGRMKAPGLESGLLLGERAKSIDPTYHASRVLDGVQKIMRLTASDAFDRMSGDKADFIAEAVKSITGKYPFEKGELNKTNFINQLGQYNKRSQNSLLVLLRDTGISPFATAGTNYYVQSMRGLTGASGARTTGLGGEIASRGEYFAKVGAVLGTVATINYFAWKRSDGDDDVPLGSIKVGEKNGKSQYLDLTSLTGLTRGARQTGMLAIAEGERAGGKKATEAAEEDKAFNNIVDSLLHPFVGPGAAAVHTAITGRNLAGYDIRQPASAGFDPTTGASQPKEGDARRNLAAAAWQANPALEVFRPEIQKKLGMAVSPKDKAAQQPVEDRAMKLLGPFGIKTKLGGRRR